MLCVIPFTLLLPINCVCVSFAVHCPAGTFAGEKQKQCTYCPRGFYQNYDRQGSCTRCPSGTYTREEGSKSVRDCVPVCGYGTYSPTGLVPCLECPRNSYSSEPPTGGFKDCQACPANTFTYQPSAARMDLCRAKCNPGQYSSTGLAPCSLCPKNYYQSQAGQSTCSECPSNAHTEGPGAKGREECSTVQCTESSCQHGGLCVALGKCNFCILQQKTPPFKIKIYTNIFGHLIRFRTSHKVYLS